MSIQTLLKTPAPSWVDLKINSITSNVQSYVNLYLSGVLTYPPIGSPSTYRPFLIKDSESIYLNIGTNKNWQLNSVSNYQGSGYTLFYLQNKSSKIDQKIQFTLSLIDQTTGAIVPYSVVYDVVLGKGSGGAIPSVILSESRISALSSNVGIGNVNMNYILSMDPDDTIWFFVNNPAPIPMNHDVLSMSILLTSLD